MTILSACQKAAVKLNQTQPVSVFSAPDTFASELVLQANETASSLLKEEHDWRALTKLATLAGDASTVAFPLPTDYERMIKDDKLHSLRFRNATFRAVRDLDEWLFLNDSLLVGSPGNWIILGGTLQIFPPMPVSDSARFYYISNFVVGHGQAAGNRTEFTADNDTFVLDERLLYLGIVWRWLSSKRMEYSEDLANYETAKAFSIGKDKGSQIIVVGRQRRSTGAELAYPALLG